MMNLFFFQMQAACNWQKTSILQKKNNNFTEKKNVILWLQLHGKFDIFYVLFYSVLNSKINLKYPSMAYHHIHNNRVVFSWLFSVNLIFFVPILYRDNIYPSFHRRGCVCCDPVGSAGSDWLLDPVRGAPGHRGACTPSVLAAQSDLSPVALCADRQWPFCLHWTYFNETSSTGAHLCCVWNRHKQRSREWSQSWEESQKPGGTI